MPFLNIPMNFATSFFGMQQHNESEHQLFKAIYSIIDFSVLALTEQKKEFAFSIFQLSNAFIDVYTDLVSIDSNNSENYFHNDLLYFITPTSNLDGYENMNLHTKEFTFSSDANTLFVYIDFDKITDVQLNEEFKIFYSLNNGINFIAIPMNYYYTKSTNRFIIRQEVQLENFQGKILFKFQTLNSIGIRLHSLSLLLC